MSLHRGKFQPKTLKLRDNISEPIDLSIVRQTYKIPPFLTPVTLNQDVNRSNSQSDKGTPIVIPAKPDSHTGRSSRYSEKMESSHELLLQVEQAKLKALHAQEAKELAQMEAERKIQQAEQIAKLEAEKTVQLARQKAEMALLEAKFLEDMVQERRHSVGTPSIKSQPGSNLEHVSEWLSKSPEVEAQVNHEDVNQNIQVTSTIVNSQPNINYSDHATTTTALNPRAAEFVSSNRNDEVIDPPTTTSNSEYNSHSRSIHQPAINKFSTHPEISFNHTYPVMSSRPINTVKSLDAWIDELVPGVETIVQNTTSASNTVNAQLSQSLIKLESERDLPKIEIPIFDGGAILWPKFIEQFYEHVHTKPGVSDNRRMDLLQSHLKGEARILVEGLGYSGRNYALALKELKNAFGHRVKVARAFLDKITTGPIIPSRDIVGLRKFYISIRDCVTTLQQLNYMSDLGSCDILMKTAKRLPADKIPKWNEYTVNILKSREPTLIDLQLWLKGRVDADFNPYAVSLDFSKKTVFGKHEVYSPSRQFKPPDRKTTLNTSITKSPSTKINVRDSSTQNTSTVNSFKGIPNKIPCCLCSEAHYLYRCQLFKDKSVSERMQLIKDKGYCCNCLKPGHKLDDCFSDMRCQHSNCGLKHHTMLHQESTVKTNTSVMAKNNKLLSDKFQSNKKVYFQLVEIIISGSNSRHIKTYGLLDSASEVTLIHDCLAMELGLKGPISNLNIQTLNKESTRISKKVSFSIRSANDMDSKNLYISEAWTVDSEAFHCPTQTLDSEWRHLDGLNIPNIHPSQVQLLIGINVPKAHLQLEIVEGNTYEPIAVRTALGWSLMGVADEKELDTHDNIQAKINLIVKQDEDINQLMENFWKTESFGTTFKYDSPTSFEDRKSLKMLEENTNLVNGHYEVGMLWKEDNLVLPNNRKVADRRFQLLEKRLLHPGNEQFQKLYSQTLNGYINKGYAHKLPELCESSSRTWYLPHHGVVNPNKPGKLRTVFDAAAVHSGTSLNDNLMTGPDLLNSLFGMLLRFRLYSVALAADVEAMFHQVCVPDRDTDSLRFLWKSDITIPGPPDIYRMNVHIFGATDSPCCASYAIKRTATDNKAKFSTLAINTTLQDFYVDDLLKSVENSNIAISLAQELTDLLQLGGFHLHKWLSNSSEVLNSIPVNERALNTTDMDLDEIPTQRTMFEDIFTFQPNPKNPSLTKRGIVSTVCSIFDPCGFLSPFTIRAKILIQEIWIRQLDWDEELPPDILSKWELWITEFKDLHKFNLPRHHLHFATTLHWIDLHIFSDASERAFGSVGYLRYSTDGNQITCSFICSKTRVAPIRPALSIPRLELQGAVLSIRLWNLLQKELHLNFRKIHFWTDSNTVLQYINNRTKRFKPFVINRIAEIQESSSSNQWLYCPSSNNPADCATRGVSVKTLTTDHLWLHGPEFLWKSEEYWPKLNSQISEIDDDDPEVKSSIMSVTLINKQTNQEDILPHFAIKSVLDAAEFSSWFKICKRTAWILRAIRNFICTIKRFKLQYIKEKHLLSKEYDDALMCWVSQAQHDRFPEDIQSLKTHNSLPLRSRLLPLSPTFDGRYLRVGGRLRRAPLQQETKHQLILPYNHTVTKHLIYDAHLKSAHGGIEHTISILRQRYWPISIRQCVKQVIRRCLYCHRQRVKPVIPRMADLPTCRLDAALGPFHYTGVDYFGPMLVKIRRGTVKRWGCLFTCLSTRAIHLELADSLETDDFILVLRNFIGRRGQPTHLYSDNGTNFHGANNELQQCLNNLKQQKVINFLLPHHIQWHFIPPASPHFGGAWERLVRSTKTALKAVLGNHIVPESVLRTALIEVEAIINSRPLTHNSTDSNDFTPLTPNHFLLGRANNTASPDACGEKEINSRKRWRQTQVLTDHVYKRWLKEFLPDLTIRHRWKINKSQPSINDLVLVVDDNQPRGKWEMGRILQLFPGDDGLVRSIKVQTTNGIYVRPSAKICILEENVD
ncbi:hypothetical protein SNE40_006050 [Patella caerulea]|uniref:Integrase catalytic domain-containing protein n=1 Tax=Patella caerulea TaxID=87958 RepID=A0AAN8K1L4_PATCE